MNSLHYRSRLWPNPWPRPADPAAAARLVERFGLQGKAEAKLASGSARVVLAAIGGNAPFLADLAVRESAIFRLVLQRGPLIAVTRVLARVGALSPTVTQAQLAASLRIAKRQIALATALADIGGIWSLERITMALSDLAELSLRKSVAHLLRLGHDRGELHLPNPNDPEHGSGFVVLAMGKLGARELNYSSDIDLVLLHDPQAGIYRGEQCTNWFSRLARNLVTLMEARDANGYVFRTDLRLRPDPAATPPSLSVHAAIIYYESMGQNWERAAMLKARPVAGDLALGQGFLDAIRPFVWRRHLDFAAVADIAAMKRRIDEHRKTALTKGETALARIIGHNVKLGQGGIREIEFLAQTLQLVWGGRDPELCERRTLRALRLLVRAGHLKAQAARELASAYRFLRSVEHRLQMVADRQTHALPETAQGLADFALFLGYDAPAQFAAELIRHLQRVQRHYQEVFAAVEGGEATLDFGDVEARPETIEALRRMGFAAPERMVEIIAGWFAGRVRALRSIRGRELLDAVLPMMLEAVSRQREPDAAFLRFAGLMESLPAGVQVLSLFQRNLELVDRIADVLGAAPQLADHLARTPSALDGLLGLSDSSAPVRQMRARLAQVHSLEEAIAAIRATVRAREFAISVATLEGRIDADAAGLLRADLADAALSGLLPRVLEDFATRNGTVHDGGMVVIAMGKAGARETMAGSDLDLMLIYDHPEHVTESQGARSLPASQWFIRAVHAFVAALTARDAEGPIYEVDMRLRPSGNKGPVAVSLSSFVAYHARDAWTWERMALTRARVVAGPPRLRVRVAAAIAQAINEGDRSKIRADAAAMRVRMLRELPPVSPWDVKMRAGGQIEVEFIAQTLQLRFGAVSQTLRYAVATLAERGDISDVDAALLIRADRIWRALQSVLRLTLGARPPVELSDSVLPTVLRVMNEAGVQAVDLVALRATLETLAQQIRAAFARLVGEIET